MSTTTSVLECSCCRISCYRNCINSTSGYNLESHDTKSVERINNSSDIQSKLRNIIPSTLYLEKGGILQLAGLRNDEARVRGLEKFVFQLHRLKRERKRMAIVYYAKDNNGVGENIAELKLLVGELKRTAGHAIKGVSLELKSFLPALTEPLVYGLLDPCAKLIVPTDAEEGIWMGLAPEIEASVTVIGEGEIDSFRVDVGLTDIVASDLIHEKDKRQHKKDFASADSRNETRRWLYPDNWKVWPKTITIKDAPQVQGRPNINGTYVRSRCRQTTTQSALWIRDDIYLLMRPNVSRTGPDIAIISTSINHEDTSSVVAVFERNWIPSDSLISKHHRQTISFKLWKEIPKMRCRIPHTKLVVTSPRDESDLLLSVHGLRDTELRRFVLEEGRQKLNLTHGPKAQQTVRVFNSLCVAPTLKYTAQNGLKFDTRVQADWLNLSSNIPFGTCDNTVPPRPTESWYWDSERDSWQRSSEPGASRNYYLQLQQAPQPFEVWIDKDENSLEVIASPTTAGHHAVSQLVGGRGGINMHEQVSVKFRLSNIALQSDPITAPFQVHNCHSCTPTNILLKAPHKLYDRQQKVVTKMLDIENGNTPFEELEMAEFEMPGQTGLSLIAKATRPRKICGGVIADAIGAGKTVISIALILKGLADARSKQKVPNQSGAILVVVPPGLIDQWEGEIKKFATSALRVVKVYGGDKTKSTSNYKVEDIIKADVVIVNVNILDSKGYFENLLDMAGLRDEVKNIPKLPSYTGQQEQIQARGVWIPNTSQDPYAGGNNPRNQSRRNESAFYTYLYNRAVQEIRKKIFTAKSKRVPLEYFEYQRVIVDEVHESLCTTKAEIPVATKSDKKVALKKKTATKKKTTDKKAAPKKKNLWKESNRRAGREFLGITQKDQSKRPLRARKAVFGLTGTPLLDSTSRIIELANLIGGTYVIGLSSHWRKLERESCRDIFLHNYLEPRQSREVRKNINSKCQSFLDTACTRNKGEKQMEGIKLVEEVKVVNMTKEEGKLYLVSQHGISPGKRHMSNRPDDFDPSAGHDISRILCQNAQFESRGTILIEICNGILEKDPKTKIVVFTDGRIGAGEAARDALVKSGLGCTCLDREDSVEETNKKIAWYQYGDATEEDKRRPRVLVLHFAHAAGLNLQTECYNMILFTPLYIGAGGTSGDAVADASTELQAIGRVYRPGQPQPFVFVYRIEVKGPANEECFDGQLIRRNTDKETIDMAINSGE